MKSLPSFLAGVVATVLALGALQFAGCSQSTTPVPTAPAVQADPQPAAVVPTPAPVVAVVNAVEPAKPAAAPAVAKPKPVAHKRNGAAERAAYAKAYANAARANQLLGEHRYRTGP